MIPFNRRCDSTGVLSAFPNILVTATSYPLSEPRRRPAYVLAVSAILIRLRLYILPLLSVGVLAGGVGSETPGILFFSRGNGPSSFHFSPRGSLVHCFVTGLISGWICDPRSFAPGRNNE